MPQAAPTPRSASPRLWGVHLRKRIPVSQKNRLRRETNCRLYVHARRGVGGRTGQLSHLKPALPVKILHNISSEECPWTIMYTSGVSLGGLGEPWVIQGGPWGVLRSWGHFGFIWMPKLLHGAN